MSITKDQKRDQITQNRGAIATAVAPALIGDGG
jgi:hypothetical protein